MDSVVADLIMPVVGLVFGKLDFSNLFLVLGNVPAGTAMTLDALRKAGVPVFAYGNFLTVAVNFIILAFIIFMMIKQINRLKREAPQQHLQPRPRARRHRAAARNSRQPQAALSQPRLAFLRPRLCRQRPAQQGVLRCANRPDGAAPAVKPTAAPCEPPR